MGASSRLRSFQYQPFLEEEGYSVEVAPFFNEAYLKTLYAHQRPGIHNVLVCYVRRLGFWLRAFSFDAVLVEKEIFPYLPAWAEWVLSVIGPGYAVDYDDALFHRYADSPSGIIRFFLKNKIAKVMRRSQWVTAGSPYIRDYALTVGAKKVIDFPTVINQERYATQLPKKEQQLPIIGWIGSPSTLKYLQEIVPALEELSSQLDFELFVINGPKPIRFSGKQRNVTWSEGEEVALIREMDIGIMPLPDDLWERGKCAYKLIQYMACGFPVVASPVGMNRDVVIHGHNGYLAATHAAWVEALTRLLTDPTLRNQMGKAGKKLVTEKYTLAQNQIVLKGLIETVGNGEKA